MPHGTIKFPLTTDKAIKIQKTLHICNKITKCYRAFNEFPFQLPSLSLHLFLRRLQESILIVFSVSSDLVREQL